MKTLFFSILVSLLSFSVLKVIAQTDSTNIYYTYKADPISKDNCQEELEKIIHNYHDPNRKGPLHDFEIEQIKEVARLIQEKIEERVKVVESDLVEYHKKRLEIYKNGSIKNKARLEIYNEENFPKEKGDVALYFGKKLADTPVGSIGVKENDLVIRYQEKALYNPTYGYSQIGNDIFGINVHIDNQANPVNSHFVIGFVYKITNNQLNLKNINIHVKNERYINQIIHNDYSYDPSLIEYINERQSKECKDILTNGVKDIPGKEQKPKKEFEDFLKAIEGN